MDIRIKRNDYEPSSETIEYANECVGSIAKHLGGDLDGVRFEVEMGKGEGHARKGDVWFAEIKVVKPGGDMFARADSESVDGALDAVREEILSQLRKEKDGKISSLREGGAEVKELLRQDVEEE